MNDQPLLIIELENGEKLRLTHEQTIELRDELTRFLNKLNKVLKEEGIEYKKEVPPQYSGFLIKKGNKDEAIN